MTATVHTFPSRPLARGRLAFAETLKAMDDPVAGVDGYAARRSGAASLNKKRAE